MRNIVTGFCSWCYQKGKHDICDTHWYTKNEYVCRKCGCFVVECTACKNMARGRLTDEQVSQLKKQAGKEGRRWVQTLGDNWKNEYCAQHDGTIPDFKTLSQEVDRLDLYPKLLKSRHVNMKKAGTIAAGALTTAGIVVLTATTGGGGAAAAAAAGKMGLLGAAGTGTAISTLSGVALTSASLAAIGGTVAAGTAIIAAVGAGLGGVTGAIVAKKYVGEDKYFGIHNKRRKGNQRTVFVNGFLQQKDVDFSDWLVGHLPCFPEESLYGVTWASKDLYELGQIFGSGTATEAAKQLFLRIGKTGTKKFNPLGPVITALGLAGNPWHVSMVRAAKTGAILADAISRSKETSYSLVGHSLGCRVIYYALQALSTKDNKKIDDVIFLGGAVGRNDPAGWRIAKSAINGTIYNCYSKNDGVLSKFYRTANANLSHPIGISPIPGRNSKIRNINCSKFIQGSKAHMMWKEHYEDILRLLYK
jgi:hypothetical protein